MALDGMTAGQTLNAIWKQAFARDGWVKAKRGRCFVRQEGGIVRSCDWRLVTRGREIASAHMNYHIGCLDVGWVLQQIAPQYLGMDEWFDPLVTPAPSSLWSGQGGCDLDLTSPDIFRGGHWLPDGAWRDFPHGNTDVGKAVAAVTAVEERLRTISVTEVLQDAAAAPNHNHFSLRHAALMAAVVGDTSRRDHFIARAEALDSPEPDEPGGHQAFLTELLRRHG